MLELKWTSKEMKHFIYKIWYLQGKERKKMGIDMKKLTHFLQNYQLTYGFLEMKGGRGSGLKFWREVS